MKDLIEETVRLIMSSVATDRGNNEETFRLILEQFAKKVETEILAKQIADV